MASRVPIRAIWADWAALARPLWRRLDVLNLVAGAVLGWLIGLPVYLKDRAEADTAREAERVAAEAKRAEDRREAQLMLRAIEQIGGQARFVRDPSGNIVDIRIELAAAGQAEASATATLSVIPAAK